jgi:membrane fusion protein (multidrug efflux system)
MPTELVEPDHELKDRQPDDQKPLAGKKPRDTSSRARLWWLLLAAFAVALAIATFAWMAYYQDRETTDDAQVDGHIVPVASKIYGNVAEVLVTDNQPIRAGQVLVRIDARDYQAKVDQAKAALALAEAQSQAAIVGVPLTRETTQSGTSSSEAQLAAADAEYERAKLACELASTSDLAASQATVDARRASNERAQADLARMKPLAAKAEISMQQLDAYEAAARVAASELKAAQEKLSSAIKDSEMKKVALLAAKAHVEQAQAALQGSKANLRKTDISAADAASAAAAVAQARANLQTAELQLSYAAIVAPEDGVVTKKMVEAGQIVQPSQGLLIIVPLHKVWVTANFKETQLAKIRPGMKAEIKVDMYGKILTGRVDSIAGATGTRLSLLPPENATGNYVKVVQRIPVKIVVDPTQGDEVLRLGMNVVAPILTHEPAAHHRE